VTSPSLVHHLSSIEDPRMDRTKKHKLLDILITTVLGFMAGNDNWTEIVEWAEHNESWLKTFLELENGIPSHDTFARVFALIDPDQFEAAFQSWVLEYRERFLPTDGAGKDRPLIAIDGKKICGTTDHKKPFTSALGMVSAWCSSAGLVLGQRKYDFGENHEKTVSRDLIALLGLKGCVVSLDANGASTDIFNAIVGKKADFVIGLKTNLKSVYKIADQIFSETRPKNKEIVSTVIEEGRAHGRVEKRVYDLIDIDRADFWKTRNRMEAFERYPHIKCLGRVSSEVLRDGKVTTDVRYFMTSLAQSDYQLFARSVRSHWEIENKLHWVLDVAFNEDRSTIHQKHAMQNVALVRRMAFNLLKSVPAKKKTSVAIKRKKAGWDHTYLHEVLVSATGLKP
jgi:predicted transposase YbfD/YdcC